MDAPENPISTPQRRTIPTDQNTADAEELVDFVLFTQRSVILNLSTELNKSNVSFPQFFLLTYLASEEYLTMTNIAKKMGHSTAASTGLIDKLEKLGFVERVYSAKDRRKIMVRITAKGVEFVARKRKEIGKDLHGILNTGGNIDTV